MEEYRLEIVFEFTVEVWRQLFTCLPLCIFIGGLLWILSKIVDFYIEEAKKRRPRK